MASLPKIASLTRPEGSALGVRQLIPFPPTALRPAQLRHAFLNASTPTPVHFSITR